MIRRLLPLLAFALPGPAHAITCSFVGATGVSFGAYDVFSSSPVDSAGTLTLLCTGVTTADNITIDLSAGGAGTFVPRTLTAPGGVLRYDLYRDAAHTVVWGDGTGGTSEYGPANPTSDVNLDLTVYGRIPALQDVPAGSYSDTIVVTVNY